jgi:putative endonuclease
VTGFAHRITDWFRHKARVRRWHSDLAAGRRGEDLAHRLLRRRGYTIVARNHRLRSGDGEADIIAWDKEKLVFVEVKSRASDEYGLPDRAIDQEKRRQLEKVAREYCRRAEVDWERIRFDVVTVVFGPPTRLDLIKDAFRPRRTI